MRWSDEEINYLKENYSLDIPVNTLAENLKKSKRSVLHKAARLNLSRIRVPHNKPKDKNHRKIIDKKYYEKNKKDIFIKRLKRLRSRKLELAKLLGGKCSECGYNQCLGALDFHHVSHNKEKSIAELLKGYSKQKTLKEAQKCILLCANCHREMHYNQDP